MAEGEVGLGKSGRRAYGFDDIAIVPSRRTRDPEDVILHGKSMPSHSISLLWHQLWMALSVPPQL